MENGYDTQQICKKENREQTTHTQDPIQHRTEHTDTDHIQDTTTHHTNKNRWHILTYNKKIVHRIGNILKKQGLQIGYRTDNTILTKLRTQTTQTDKFNRSGIYELKCNTCQAVYIGQTCRNFKTRYSEHLRALKRHSSHSTFADHLVAHNHHPTKIETELKILKTSHSLYHKLTIEENYHIQKAIAEAKAVIDEYTTLCRGTFFKTLKELYKNDDSDT